MDGSNEPRIKEKRWKIEFEEEMIKKWENEDWWKFDPNSDKPVFVIDTPPPYPAPVWHIGAAVSYSMQDIIARIHRMLGYNVLYPVGMDRNGIPIEMYVEKYEKINMWEHDRDDFERLCKSYLDQWTEKMRHIMKRLELSGDYEENYYQTDWPEYRGLTQLSFKILWEKGLIYEAERPNNWCPHCKTTIADAEIEYKERDGTLYYLKYRIKETGEDLIVATTRPELLFGCKAIIVHPEDERYKHLHGKTAIVPLIGREVPIIPHREADPEFGTGVVHICSFGDVNDVRIFRELKLEPVKVINTDGTLTEAAGKYAGMTVKEARKAIVEDLRAAGLLVKEEGIKHKVPVHERCKHEIEIIPMKEYYLKQTEFLDTLRKYVEEMDWYPEKYKQHLLNWINSVTVDWPISRRRYYGTELPIWYNRKTGERFVYADGKYRKPWKELPPELPEGWNPEDVEGEWRTLDTWMDSSISVLFVTRWMRDEEFFKRTFVNGTKLRPQGYEIIRTWLYYSLLRVHQLTGSRAFDKVFINGMGLDEKGRKMSKSLGNVIDPFEIINKYGTDALRMYIALETSIGENYRISDQKIAGAGKFLTKLWNIARFISMFQAVDERPELTPTDEWILSELNRVREKVIDAYREFDFHSAAIELRKFTWNVFADHYIELVKRRARGEEGFSKEESKAARWTLYEVLRQVLLLFAPIIPAITDRIWRELFSEESIHAQEFPEPIEGIKDYTELTEKIAEFNSYVWNTKKEKGIKFYEPIEGIEIPDELEPFRKDLVATHRIR